MRILASLLLLLSTSAFAAGANINVSNVVGVGGIQGSNPSTAIADFAVMPISDIGNTSGLKTLVSTNLTSSSAVYYRFYDPSAGTGNQYQVGNGKNFSITSICFETNGASGFAGTLGTATATFNDGDASVTGGWYFTGASTSEFLFSGTAPASSVGFKCANFPIPAAFKQNTYPFFIQNYAGEVAGHRVYLIGVEK